MKNLTWQNPEQLFVAQVLFIPFYNPFCGFKVYYDDGTLSTATGFGILYSYSNFPYNAAVYIPKGSLGEYLADPGWSWFQNFYEMGVFEAEINVKDIKMSVGQSQVLTVKITKDDDVTIVSESWSSSNPDVASVDNGTVKAIGEGSSTILFTLIDGYGLPHTQCCEVTVTSDAAVDCISEEGGNISVEYYNLNGLRVDGNCLSPGIYIKKTGHRSEKVSIR